MFDYATTGLTLAIAHHILIFLIAGILAFEIGVIRSNMKREDVLRVARVDIWYGADAGRCPQCKALPVGRSGVLRLHTSVRGRDGSRLPLATSRL